MEKFIGTKVILAKPMTRGEYNEYRGWECPKDENPDDQGFFVEYLDGGKSNHSDHKGYISWSPEGVFERAYRSTTGGVMSFGNAVRMMKIGLKVAREGWNGKGMFLFQIDGNAWDFTTDSADESVNDMDTLPFICMKTADNKLVPWLASQTDVLSEDWVVVS